MNKVFLIAKREIIERFQSRFFKGMMIVGPLLILLGIYLFLANTASVKKDWNVLIMDQDEILEGKFAITKPKHLSFDFINAFLDYAQFGFEKRYEDYDLAVSINEKIVSNKHVVIYYKEKPPLNIQRELVYLVERRLEEIMVKEFTDLSVDKFREIKQSLSFSLRDTYDPKGLESNAARWVGFTFGTLIMFFIFLFGMNILRGVSREKSTRIVEVLLSSVKARHLMAGKVLGIGFSAIVQFLIWTLLIGGGLYLFRMTIFPDIFSGNFVVENIIESNSQLPQQSPFIDLIYNQIQYGSMILFFLLFFIGGYLFYGSFFTFIGASMGSESDGQQFVIPLILLLSGTILTGIYVVYHPSGGIGNWAGFVPFSSPVVMMIKFSEGFIEDDTWKLFLSLIILFSSAIFMLYLAGRIYKNGLLQFNHRLKLRNLRQWIKR